MQTIVWTRLKYFNLRTFMTHPSARTKYIVSSQKDEAKGIQKNGTLITVLIQPKENQF